MIKLYLSAPYSNEFVKKISRREENIGALLLIKVENLEIEQFIKILVMQQRFGGMQRSKEKKGIGNGKKNIRNVLEKLNG